jgi:hypothetical protein
MVKGGGAAPGAVAGVEGMRAGAGIGPSWGAGIGVGFDMQRCMGICGQWTQRFLKKLGQIVKVATLMRALFGAHVCLVEASM